MFERQVVYETVLQPDEVMDALHRKTEIRGVESRPVAALFEGRSISISGFELRLIGPRNDASTSLRGEVTGSSAGSTVAVRIGLSDPFSAFWMAGCALAAVGALLGVRSWGQAPAGVGVSAVAAALLLLHHFLLRRAFDVSAATAELALRDALSATRVGNDIDH